MIKIYMSTNNDKAELDCIEKGCRMDVLVEIDGRYYRPLINTLGRLQQEVEEAFSQGLPYKAETCEIIVAEANSTNIIDAILYLNKEGFFDAFVPVDLKILFQHGFQHLSDISNWVQIY